MGIIRARKGDVGNDEETEFLSSARPAVFSEHRRRLPPWKTWLGILFLGALVAVTILGWGYSGKVSTVYEADGFITVEGTKLMHKCRPFYVVGFNVDNLAEAMTAVTQGRKATPGMQTGEAAVRGVLRRAAGAGVNAVRTWAHTTNPDQPLQVSAGVYSEDAMHALDVVIAEAQAAGLRVVLSLADNWKYEGGVDEFVDWAPSVPARDAKYPVATGGDGDVSDVDWSDERREYEARRKALFFTDTGVKKLYRAHARAILERVNSVTGRMYKNDPTIMALDLLNEPRCEASYVADCAKHLEQWIYEMATHVKSLDQNHLVTVGMEGFWGTNDKMKANNPGGPQGLDWASKAGQDFIAQHVISVIDFATIHIWPDNWLTDNATFTALWIEKHVEDATKLLKKPIIIEEYGKKLEEAVPSDADIAATRDPVFRTVLTETERHIAADSALAGSMFWRWGFNAWNAQDVGEYGILPDSSTFRIIRSHAQRVKAYRNSAPAASGCSSECWVGTATLGLSRCEQQPAICKRQAKPEAQALRADASGGRLQSAGIETFASHAECCLPGLGAFEAGCSTKVV